MRDLLLKYMSHFPNDIKTDPVNYGPVITISREYGCYGSGIAAKLSERINSGDFNNEKEWKVVDRHILSKVSNELHANPANISHVFGADQRGFLADIIDSFAPKNYTSDHRVISTIKKVVRNFAEDGNTIIVGRAGCIIAGHIPKALHVRIIASYEDRVKSVMKHLDLTEKEAMKRVDKISKKRKQFMAFFNTKESECDLFDIIFNKSKMSEEAIIEGIIQAAKHKSVLAPY